MLSEAGDSIDTASASAADHRNFAAFRALPRATARSVVSASNGGLKARSSARLASSDTESVAAVDVASGGSGVSFTVVRASPSEWSTELTLSAGTLSSSRVAASPVVGTSLARSPLRMRRVRS